MFVYYYFGNDYTFNISTDAKENLFPDNGGQKVYM